MEHCLKYALFLVTQFVIGYCWFYLLSESLDHHFGSIWRPLGPFWHHFGDQVGHRCAQSNPGRSQDGFWMMTESAPWAVNVRQFRAKPLCEGGFGGKQVKDCGPLGFNLGDVFLVFFLVWSQITFSLVLGALWGAFASLLGSILTTPGTSENWSPSRTKTIVLQIWRVPDWYLFCVCVQDQFLNTFFWVFCDFSDILGVPVGASFGHFYSFFFRLAPRVVFGCQKWSFWVPFGGLRRPFGCLFGGLWSNLRKKEKFANNKEQNEWLWVIWNNLQHLGIFMRT